MSHRCDSAPPLRVEAPQGPSDIRQILASFLLLLHTIIMPHEYRAEVKIQFPLPEYPQEGQYEDPVQYEVAIMQFGVDHVRVLVERKEWVDHEQITDIACASEAAHLQAEADKW